MCILLPEDVSRRTHPTDSEGGAQERTPCAPSEQGLSAPRSSTLKSKTKGAREGLKPTQNIVHASESMTRGSSVPSMQVPL